MHTGEDPYKRSIPVCLRALTVQAVAPCMMWWGNACSCMPWLAYMGWYGQCGGSNTRQTNQSWLAQRSKRAYSTGQDGRCWNGEEDQNYSYPGSETVFELGRGGSGSSPSSPSVVVVRDVDGDGKEVGVQEVWFRSLILKTENFCLFILAEI